MKLSGKGAGEIYAKMFVTGEIQYRTVFLKLPASLIPPFRVGVFSFPLHPPLFHRSTAFPAAASYFGYTRKLLTASIFRYSARGRALLGCRYPAEFAPHTLENVWKQSPLHIFLVLTILLGKLFK